MRWVTRNPPAILMVAIRTAIPARMVTRFDWAGNLQQCTDDDNTADRIGDAHQRGMQRRGNVPDDLVADEAGEHENGQVLHEVRRCHRAKTGENKPADDQRDRRFHAHVFGRRRLDGWFRLSRFCRRNGRCFGFGRRPSDLAAMDDR